MDTHAQIAAASDAGPTREDAGRGRLKRAVPAILAALVLAPGVLLAEPIKHEIDALMADSEPLGAPATLGTFALGAVVHRHDSVGFRLAGAGGGASIGPVSGFALADPSGRDGLLEFADDQASGLAANGDLGLGLDANGSGAATVQGRAGADIISALSGEGRNGGGAAPAAFGLGGGGGGGGAGGGGLRGFGGAPTAPTAPLAGASDQGASPGSLDLTGPDAGSSDKMADTASGVPESAAWISMILGFGLTGASLRRRGHRQAE